MMDEDKYIAAAQAILDDLSDRSGIGNVIDAVDDDVRAEMIQSIADIIRRVDRASA